MGSQMGMRWGLEWIWGGYGMGLGRDLGCCTSSKVFLMLLVQDYPLINNGQKLRLMKAALSFM